MRKIETMPLTKIAFYFGIMWIAAALWVDAGGDEKFVWMLLIPSVYIALVQLLRE